MCMNTAIIALLCSSELFFFPFGVAESRNAGVDRPPCGLSRLETGAVSSRLLRCIAAPRFDARPFYVQVGSPQLLLPLLAIWSTLVFLTYDGAMKSRWPYRQ
ncbi:hypothetical protein GGI43DRAFT_245842 [Trichoderma evansii]